MRVVPFSMRRPGTTVQRDVSDTACSAYAATARDVKVTSRAKSPVTVRS